MANELLKKLEEKIIEAIETIELSRIEVTDLKEQNEELENRYADWETRLSTLIENSSNWKIVKMLSVKK